MTHHVTSVRSLVLVWLALIVLTITTTAVGYADLGPFNVIVAITIAVIKMLLVVVIFMGVRWANSLTRLFAAAGLFWFLILIVLLGQDYATRGWLPGGKMW